MKNISYNSVLLHSKLQLSNVMLEEKVVQKQVKTKQISLRFYSRITQNIETCNKLRLERIRISLLEPRTLLKLEDFWIQFDFSLLKDRLVTTLHSSVTKRLSTV